MFNIGYFIGYQLLFGAFMAYVMTTMPESPLFLLIFPFHLYAMFCGLYAMYFISKALVSVEKQEDVDYNQFGGVFLMLLFFPIGIWFLQPRIQKIFK